MHRLLKKVLISNEEIQERSKQLAKQIDEDYKDCTNKPLLVALLKGSVPFLAELIKYIESDIEIDFMDVSSYEGTESCGDIRILKDLDCSIRGIDVIIVEDIVDTGKTIEVVKEMMMNKGARSCKVVTLLDKPARRTCEVQAEYIGFEIGNEFVVGFGLDYNQKLRNLPYVGIMKEEAYK